MGLFNLTTSPLVEKSNTNPTVATASANLNRRNSGSRKKLEMHY